MQSFVEEDIVAQSTLVLMRYAVRHGVEPDDPNLLMQWFSVEETMAEHTKEGQWACLLFQFELLLDTFADVIVPAHWRSLCLDNINRPLRHLGRIADTEDKQFIVEQLFDELRVISHHFH